MLREAGAAVVLGGDTHDLEYCAETVPGPRGPWVQHHFVNGGDDFVEWSAPLASPLAAAPGPGG